MAGERREGPDSNQAGARHGWAQRRRDRIVAEIQRNRRGEYQVPTWVLAVILVAFVAAWLTWILLS
jgi:hypothetical protein